MTEAETSPRTDDDFVRGLQRLAARDESPDRAALARLRRSLAQRGVDYSALRDAGDLLPTDHDIDRDLDTYLLVAGLFALHPQPNGTGSLGQALHALRRKLSVGQESLDLRFSALLDSDHEDLPYRLRQLVQLLASRDVPVNYFQLLRDLRARAWEAESRWVQRRWAQDYWTA